MKKIIVMMGGQGVGKGTFSNMLANRFEYDHVETGAMLRALPSDSPIAQTIARGELVSDEMLFGLIADKLGNSDVILDGFPRTLGQAKWLVENFADKYDIRVIYLEIPEELMLARINKRIREGGGRSDDADVAAVRRRLDTFWNVTVPAIEWLRNAQGIKFAVVHPDDVDTNKNFEKVLSVLN
ncbi:MAG: nucleoside monophosphate kinase [Proteobacteria bacterium]|nr:nucleoside monophosphate kinase [Candidatus Enterousia scatequi]